MSEPIAEKLESYDLQRFRNDLRRAVLMQRKGRLTLFFRLHFPTAEPLFGEGRDLLEQLDFRQWLTEPLLEEVSGHRVYRDLVAEQERLLLLVQGILESTANNAMTPEQLARLLRALHDFDRIADRLDSGITTSLTDIDELTGLLNRTAMLRDLDRERAQARRTGRPFTVAMVDADHFKKVNDEHGHVFGDVCLETLAERFIESIRPRDQVYRYGGEEFLVLLPDTPLAKAKPVLERLRRRAIERAISDGETAIKLSVSVGAAEAASDEEPSAAIDRADAALYRAKEAGRNRLELDHVVKEQTPAGKTRGQS
jgi:diguanylate cyclase (GGDEF)-like protein